jgi:hypothetical protein
MRGACWTLPRAGSSPERRGCPAQAEQGQDFEAAYTAAAGAVPLQRSDRPPGTDEHPARRAAGYAAIAAELSDLLPAEHHHALASTWVTVIGPAHPDETDTPAAG